MPFYFLYLCELYLMPRPLCAETAEIYLEATFLHDGPKGTTLDFHLTKILCDNHCFRSEPLSLELRNESMGACQRTVAILSCQTCPLSRGFSFHPPTQSSSSLWNCLISPLDSLEYYNTRKCSTGGPKDCG